MPTDSSAEWVSQKELCKNGSKFRDCSMASGERIQRPNTKRMVASPLNSVTMCRGNLSQIMKKNMIKKITIATSLATIK